MSIRSFLQVEKGDPDWLFSPDEYFGKQFKLNDANTVELKDGKTDSIVLRLTPTEKGMLAKHLKIDVREGANLDLIIINESAPTLQQVFLYDIKIREGAFLQLGIFAKGGKLNKHIFHVEIEDSGNLASYGYMSNNDGGDTEIITKVFQQGEQSICTQLIGAQAGEESQTVYQGIVKIDPNSELAETSLESVNIVTGNAGRCFSRPEVVSDNVTAKVRYGSQTQCLDSNITFYLASKGMAPEDSQDLVIKGFQEAIFDLIAKDEIREEVEQLFNTKE
jgi:Fe-S cluster assembly protein SufD